jgi:hypothetical protein
MATVFLLFILAFFKKQYEVILYVIYFKILIIILDLSIELDLSFFKRFYRFISMLS